jgi:hypothetical protein
MARLCACCHTLLGCADFHAVLARSRRGVNPLRLLGFVCLPAFREGPRGPGFLTLGCGDTQSVPTWGFP